MDLDELSGHLITEGAGDVLQFRELRTPRKAVGIKLAPEFAGYPAQAVLKFLPNRSSVLAHLRSPLPS